MKSWSLCKSIVRLKWCAGKTFVAKSFCCQVFPKAPLREKLLNSLHQANCESLGPEILGNGDFFTNIFARSLNFYCDLCQKEIWKPRRKRTVFFAACWKLLKTNVEKAHHWIMSSCELFTVPESYYILLDVHLHTMFDGCFSWSLWV